MITIVITSIAVITIIVMIINILTTIIFHLPLGWRARLPEASSLGFHPARALFHKPEDIKSIIVNLTFTYLCILLTSYM